MGFHDSVMHIDKGVSKTIIVTLAAIIIGLGAAIMSLTSMLASPEIEPVIYGLALIWLGSLAFFYAVITEEHTMKELFLRQAYFFTGIVVMILGLFFVSLSGMTVPVGDAAVVEFGLLLLIGGAALILLSAQKTRDYSKRSGFIAAFSGVVMMIGGIMAGLMNVAYAGVFILMFAVVWLGLRSRYAV